MRKTATRTPKAMCIKLFPTIQTLRDQVRKLTSGEVTPTELATAVYNAIENTGVKPSTLERYRICSECGHSINVAIEWALNNLQLVVQEINKGVPPCKKQSSKSVKN